MRNQVASLCCLFILSVVGHAQTITATALTNATTSASSFTMTSGAPDNEAAYLFQDTETASPWMHPATFTVSNPLSSAHILVSAGTSYSSYNQAYFGLYYVSPNSPNNYGTLGLFSKDDILVWTPAGNVGIGTSSPGSKLEVNGNLKLTSGSGASVTFADGTVQSTAWTGSLCGGDYAESVDVTGKRTHYEPGDVLVIDPDHPGHFLKARERYSTRVAGIYSTKPGLVGRRQTTTDPKRKAAEVPMAMVGIVPTKVSTENGPIKTGDLLVTSSTPGYAMKGTDRSLLAGAIVGKALDNLASGKGMIEAMVSLQ